FIPGDPGGEIRGRNVADDRMSIAPLEVDDRDGVGFAQRHVSAPVIGYRDAVRVGTKDAAGDGNTESDGARDLIGIQVDDRKAVAVGIGYVKGGTRNGHAGGMHADVDGFDFFAGGEIDDGNGAGEGECIFGIGDDPGAVGIVGEVARVGGTSAFIAHVGEIAVDDDAVGSIAHG